jgi:hypothetical protein
MTMPSQCARNTRQFRGAVPIASDARRLPSQAAMPATTGPIRTVLKPS